MDMEQDEAMPSGAVNQAISGKEVAAPAYFMSAYPNPVITSSTIKYRLITPGDVSIKIYDAKGNQVKAFAYQNQSTGTYSVQWNASGIARGIYFINATINGQLQQTVRVTKQ